MVSLTFFKGTYHVTYVSRSIPWRTDYLEQNDNMVTANITGLEYLTDRMESPEGVKGSSGQPNKNDLTTFGFYQDFKPEFKIHQDGIRNDKFYFR